MILSIHSLGFYALGFLFGGYMKSLITGGPITATMWIQITDKEKKPKGSKINLPWVPELLGALIVGGFLHYVNSH
jgi:hypothetical protein